MAETHFITSLCIQNSVREKNKRCFTGGMMMVDEIKSEKIQKMKRRAEDLEK